MRLTSIILPASILGVLTLGLIGCDSPSEKKPMVTDNNRISAPDRSVEPGEGDPSTPVDGQIMEGGMGPDGPGGPGGPGGIGVPVPPAPIIGEPPVPFNRPVGQGPGGRGGNVAPVSGNLDNWVTDDEENDDDDDFPHGVCGNGIQEVLPLPKGECPAEMYGSVIQDNGLSTLVTIDPHSGAFLDIGTITDIDNNGPYALVQSLEFSPTGLLYGLGVNVEDNFWHLILIDCFTGQAQNVGSTGLSHLNNFQNISDMSVDVSGRTFFYEQNHFNLYHLALVNANTTLVGSSLATLPNPDGGNGLAFVGFPSPNILFLASDGFLSELSTTTGAASSSIPLNFPGLFNGGPGQNLVNSIDQNYFTSRVFASVEDTHGNFFLTRIDTGNGDVIDIGATARGLQAIAVNQIYEECDGGFVPSGTSCIDCLLIETNCADGFDNDGNGLADCADLNCANQPCNNNDPCQINDVCVPFCPVTGEGGTCVGVSPCTSDTVCATPVCTVTGSTTHTCTTDDTEAGTPCEPDEDVCTVDECDGSGNCDHPLKTLVPVAQGGCLTTNECELPICEDDEEGSCNYAFADGILCSCGDVIGECTIAFEDDDAPIPLSVSCVCPFPGGGTTH